MPTLKELEIIYSNLLSESNLILSELKNGEITSEELELKYDLNLMERENTKRAISDKIEFIGNIIPKIEHEIEEIERIILYYRSLAKKRESIVSYFKSKIRMFLDSFINEKEISGHTLKYILKRSKKSVVVLDESIIPEKYFILKTEKVLDKERARLDLENGLKIDGLSLEDSYSLNKYNYNNLFERK